MFIVDVIGTNFMVVPLPNNFIVKKTYDMSKLYMLISFEFFVCSLISLFHCYSEITLPNLLSQNIDLVVDIFLSIMYQAKIDNFVIVRN